MLQEIFQNVISVSITTSILIGILLLLLPLFHKKYTAKWRYWVWLVIAVRLIIPFSPSIPRPPIEISAPTQNVDIKIPLHNPVSTPVQGTITESQPVRETGREETIPITEVLVILWLLGAVLFILYYIIGYRIFVNSIKRVIRPVEEGRAFELFNEVKRDLKITKNIGLYSCKRGISPMMTGFFKPVLLLPDFELENDNLSFVIKHELTHYKRKDIWYKVLLLIANGIHWFNPLVYIVKNLSEKDLEMVCDSEVIRNTDINFKRKYSETILLAIHNGNIHNTAFSTYIHGGKKTMKKRFSNIFDKGKKKRGIAALCLILAAVCLIGGFAAWEHKDSVPEESLNTAETSETSDNGVKRGNQIIYGDNSYGNRGDQAEIPDLPDTSDSLDADDSSDSVDTGYKGSYNTDTDNQDIVGTDTADRNTAETDTADIESADNSSASDTIEDNTNVDSNSIIYENNQYGFNFILPSAWKDYKVLADKWEGIDFNESQKVTETGPIITIRHPLWTSREPRQDIPIMVFTLNQWEAMQQDTFHIGAAPVNPMELGRNSQYVFALPARYNFAFPAGYEEVENIMENAPLKPTENITANK